MSEQGQRELERVAAAIYTQEHPGRDWNKAQCKPAYLDMARAALAAAELTSLRASQAALVERLAAIRAIAKRGSEDTDASRAQFREALAEIETIAAQSLTAQKQEPNGLDCLKAILADQQYMNDVLTVAQIERILKNEGGFMPDEAVMWFRATDNGGSTERTSMGEV